MLNKLRDLCDGKLNECKRSGDLQGEEIYKTIREMMKDDDMFKKLDAEVSLNILVDLGIDKRNLKEVYGSLLK